MENGKDKVHDLVIEKYSEIAKGKSGGCIPVCCDGATPLITIQELGKALDYEEEDLLLAPGEAKRILSSLGFQGIVVTTKEKSEEIIRQWHVNKGTEKVVFSAYLQAVKPMRNTEQRGAED
jgi:hypothetical protein